jgi:hypothetical protein
VRCGPTCLGVAAHAALRSLHPTNAPPALSPPGVTNPQVPEKVKRRHMPAVQASLLVEQEVRKDVNAAAFLRQRLGHMTHIPLTARLTSHIAPLRWCVSGARWSSG